MDRFDRYKKSVLNNGISIVTEAERYFYSVTIGIWVKNGSRHESPRENGVSHFIEHMLFKGTEKRSALDIAKEIDSIGGVINAFTTREATCYYVKVMKEHLEKALDLLTDIFLNSLFDVTEFEREKEVILQEIRMVEDTPDDYIHDLFYETFWRDFPLGRPVIGSSETVSVLTSDDLIRYMKNAYTSDRIVIAASGNIDHDELTQRFHEDFSDIGRGGYFANAGVPVFSSNVALQKKRLEQVHLCLGTKGVSGTSDRRHAAYILNAVLGDGMSSRLFQEVRENRGLAYSVYSYLSSYEDAGLLGVYAGTSLKNLPEVLKIIVAELKRLKTEPLSEEELVSATEQIKGNIVLGLENSEARMQRLANNEIYFGRNIPVRELLKKIDGVTSADVLSLARELITQDSLNIAVLGNIRRKDLSAEIDRLKNEISFYR